MNLENIYQIILKDNVYTDSIWGERGRAVKALDNELQGRGFEIT